VPKVSVVIPSYNRAEFVGQAIQSVLDQTWPNLELVVVDDGSTDHSMDVLRGFGDRIQVLTHPQHENHGQSASINLGLQHTDGQYVAILDSDDWWEKNKLERQVNYLQSHPEIGLVYGNGWSVSANGEKLFRFYESDHREESDPARVLQDCYFLVPNNSLFRRDVLTKTGLFDESLRSAQDHDMAIRMAESTRIGYIPDEIFFYRRHEDSISHRSTRLRWENGFRILKRAVARYPYSRRAIRGRRAVLNFRLAQVCLSEGAWFRGLSHLLAALANDPARSIRVITGREKISAPSS
jgi:glycosyltransferase involved in cell wall biosynthesis